MNPRDVIGDVFVKCHPVPVDEAKSAHRPRQCDSFAPWFLIPGKSPNADDTGGDAISGRWSRQPSSFNGSQGTSLKRVVIHKEHRYVNFTGPKVKKSRALGVALTPKAQKYMKNRPYPPGQHGQRRRRRPSDYGVQLLEKQRLRFQYNVSESQLRKAYKQATRMPGSTGDNLVQLLETRMDCLVLRAGLAPTIYAARQYVTHGHFRLNGKKATIPSQRLKVGDVITVREKSQQEPDLQRAQGAVAPLRRT